MHAEWRLSRVFLRAPRPSRMRHHGRMPDRTANVDEGWRAVRAASPAVDGGARRGRLTFLGHSTVLIEVDDLRILTDPVLREGFGPVRRQVQAVLPELFEDLDAVFISHGHHDHLDLAVPAPYPGQADGHRPARLPALRGAGGPRPGRGGRARRPADDRPRPVRGAVRRALGTPRAVRADRPGDRLPHRGIAHRLLPRRHRPVPRDGRARRAARRRDAPGLGLGPDDRRGPPEPGARRGGRGHPPAAARPSRSTGAPSTRRGCGGSHPGRSTSRAASSPTRWPGSRRTSRPASWRPARASTCRNPRASPPRSGPAAPRGRETRRTPPLPAGFTHGSEEGISRTRRGRRSRGR